MILLLFPNQLFDDHPGLELRPSRVILIEHSLFFGDHRYPMEFHQQKMWLHRSTMKHYQCLLEERGFRVAYVDYDSEQTSLAKQLQPLIDSDDLRDESLAWVDPTDFVLEKRLQKLCDELNRESEVLDNPGFFNSRDENAEYRAEKNRWFMADFYKWQRVRLDLLMDGDEPRGGQWSFDEDNRKKIPKKQVAEIPELDFPEPDDIDLEARDYVQDRFADRPGNLDRLYYPTTHESAREWLGQFLSHRFDRFGDYEDAIEQGHSWLWHSVLTPALNIGLLTPSQVVDEAIAYAADHDVPINSLEGFLRQIVGWREFMRATYEDSGVAMRTGNHWNHHRKMPRCFYDATTGIDPIDDTVRRILDTGYCHHIERLMVLGGFMFLCEIDPTEIYRWFMEMFVDSYDWVMVPNAYAMSQHADGGLITTKPYFSGSSYIRKMSHYGKADWCDVWDGLYWRWIWNHHDELSKNPRWAMMCAMAKKMDEPKREQHIECAESFLQDLS